MNSHGVKAIAVFTDEIKGTVKFSEFGSKVKIDLYITGLKPNSLHGFHVHEAGDLSDKCTSMCAHFNPYGKTHVRGPEYLNRLSEQKENIALEDIIKSVIIPSND